LPEWKKCKLRIQAGRKSDCLGACSGDETMQCPNCQREKSIGRLQCDCGYNYETQAVQKSYSAFRGGIRAPRLAVHDLLKMESRLNRSFYAAVSALVLYLINNLLLGPMLSDFSAYTMRVVLAIAVCLLLAIAGYVWYIVAVYQTAKIIHKPYGFYLVWVIIGPVLCQIPVLITLPMIYSFVSMGLAATPLAAKFLLSNELRTMIRIQTLRDLH
jgi:hypothetical protein